MTRRTMKRWQPGGMPPWEHNVAVAKRKRFLRVARQFRAASRQATVAQKSFRELGVAAQHAADSLRELMRGAAA